jgi:hypothetical protein
MSSDLDGNMSSRYCDKEERVFAALNRGTPDAAILDHAPDCPVCSEVLLVAESLRAMSQLADHELHALPDPGLVWRKAQARAKKKALAKATLPIRIMRACAAALAIFASPWMFSQLFHPLAWIANLGFGRFPWIEGSWITVLTGTTLLGITAGFACIGAGSWYMLREK